MTLIKEHTEHIITQKLTPIKDEEKHVPSMKYKSTYPRVKMLGIDKQKQHDPSHPRVCFENIERVPRITSEKYEIKENTR